MDHYDDGLRRSHNSLIISDGGVDEPRKNPGYNDFERHKQRGSAATDYKAADKNDEFHRVMMEVEPLLEASGNEI